jgi:hypothetical protein
MSGHAISFQSCLGSVESDGNTMPSLVSAHADLYKSKPPFRIIKPAMVQSARIQLS